MPAGTGFTGFTRVVGTMTMMAPATERHFGLALALILAAAGLANAAWQTWRADGDQVSCLAIEPECVDR